MPLSIIHYPHPTLRHKSQPIRRVDRELKTWVAEMFDLMYEHEGVGLAANQVDLPYRMFVMNPTGNSQEKDAEQVLINPVLSKMKGQQEGNEGCLSIPGVHADVMRAKTLHVEAFDLAGNLIEADLDGFAARVVQHENDHLDGILFIDRLSDGNLAEIRGLIDEFEVDFQSRLATGEAPTEEQVAKKLAELERLRT
ncbi:peptide deformylase [Aeoliella sp. ICT_H6.2]|uniref:Peptide deformylase n=1 Tax=Aeoliella straminimaris TaxID=2954799 RepID=A0A9X2FH77_9BACT|nr:peptide deformylase [Aeoliella straminimaris]MCO6045741.1 peptide deformylase [Aeoliella straminimaris]